MSEEQIKEVQLPIKPGKKPSVFKAEPKVHRHPVDPTRSKPVLYYVGCALCREEDEARRASETPNIPADQVDTTFFLYPDYAPEKQVCEAYLRRKYPNLNPGLHGSSVPRDRLMMVPEFQVVAVRRVPLLHRSLSPIFRREIMKDLTWHDVPVDQEDLIPEVLESAPISIADSIEAPTQTFFQSGSTSDAELVARLCDVFHGYRVATRVHIDPPSRHLYVTAIA
jgi:hypothetical protein